MFDQRYFDHLSDIVVGVNKHWKELFGESLIPHVGVEIVLRDGARFSIRMLERTEWGNDNLLHVIVHGDDADGHPRLLCVPFIEITRVEMVERAPGHGARAAGFQQ